MKHLTSSGNNYKIAEPTQMVNVRCYSCGYVFGIEPGRTGAFCSNCGIRLSININEYIITDHAKIAQVQADRDVRMRELELEKKKHEDYMADPSQRVIDSMSAYLLKRQELKMNKKLTKAELELELQKLESERLRLEAQSARSQASQPYIVTPVQQPPTRKRHSIWAITIPLMVIAFMIFVLLLQRGTH